MQRKASKINKKAKHPNFSAAVVIAAALIVQIIFLNYNISFAAFQFQTKNPNTEVGNDNSNGGTQSWTNAARVETSDDSYATSALSDDEASKYLKVTNFAFTIPSAAVIKGVVVDAERKVSKDESDGFSPVKDAAVRLVKGGIIGSTDRSAATSYPKSDAYESHGDQSDLWGLVLTPADVNASNFGAAFAAKKYGADGGNVTVSVDHIRITVYYNNPPVSNNSIVSGDEDTAQTITLGAADADGDALTYFIVTAPFHGSLGPISGNQVTYTPSQNYNGSDSFAFKANDGSDDSNTALVSITVNAVNDAPAAQNQNASTDEDLAIIITLPATDVENDPLTYSIETVPTNGVLGAVSGNQVTYTPNLNFNGSDSFTFKANDGQADSNVATVNITINPVNDPPVASGQNITTDEDTAVTITLSASDPEGNPLSYAVVSEPANGALSAVADNQVTYTPGANFNGQDSFTFKANDGQTDGNTALISITVNAVNDAPILAPIGNKSVTKPETLQFTAIATDPESPPEILTFSLVEPPAGASINASSGEFSWTPGESIAAGDYTVIVQISDGSLTDSETIMITINAANVPENAGNNGAGGGNASSAASGVSGYSQSFATPVEGGKIILPKSGSEIQLNVPPGAVSANTLFAITAAPQETYSNPDLSSGLVKVNDLVFEITAADGTVPVTVFLQPLAISFHYQDSDIPGVDEIGLAIYLWDKTSGQWIALPSQVDAANNAVSAATVHLSVFGLMSPAQPVNNSVAAAINQSVLEKPSEPKKETAAINEPAPKSASAPAPAPAPEVSKNNSKQSATAVNSSGFLAAAGAISKDLLGAIYNYFKSFFQ